MCHPIEETRESLNWTVAPSERGMTTAATNLLKSASESDVHGGGARGEGGREGEQLRQQNGRRRRHTQHRGREESNIPAVLLLLDVRPSICRGWDLEVGIAMTTACFNVFLPPSLRSRSQVLFLRSHSANGATYEILRVGQRITEEGGPLSSLWRGVPLI